MTRHPSQPFSLVLGGGGARGYIHIGVLQYLEEHHIVPSEIIGTSMGALIGGARAAGVSTPQITQAFTAINRTSLFDIDYTTASIQGNQVEHALENLIGNHQIQDLPIPYKAIATCLDDSSKKVFDHGSLIDAIRASISIPGVISPHTIDRKRYIDGGLVANLPIGDASSDTIIAVSAAKSIHHEIETTSQLRNRELPRNPLAVNKDILRRSTNLLLKTQEDQAIQLCTKNLLLIRPDNPLSLLDMDKIQEGIQLGYDEAKKILSNI